MGFLLHPRIIKPRCNILRRLTAMKTQRDELEQQRKEFTTALINEKLKREPDYNRIRYMQQRLDDIISYLKNLD